MIKLCIDCGNVKKSRTGERCAICAGKQRAARFTALRLAHPKVNIPKKSNIGNTYSLGLKRSDETKAKMSKAAMGHIVSEETREKLRQANLGKKISPEAKRKISEASKKMWESEEMRKEQSLRSSGRKHTPEARVKMSKAQMGNKKATGRIVSAETKKKLSDANMGHVVTAETRAKQSASTKGRVVSDEWRQNMSAGWSPHGKMFNTDIEIKIKLLLASWGIPFIHQYKIGISGSGWPDFYLPNSEAVIECDGDYWHSLPGAKEKDRKKDGIRDAIGMPVLRLLGSDIKNHWDDVMERVHDFLMATKYVKNWKSQAAWLRMMSKRLMYIASKIPKEDSRNKLEDIAREMLERASKIEGSVTPNG